MLNSFCLGYVCLLCDLEIYLRNWLVCEFVEIPQICNLFANLAKMLWFLIEKDPRLFKSKMFNEQKHY